MHMTMLKKLHNSMIMIKTDLQQFKITSGAASFDCLFSTREEPFILALTSRGDNPKFFKFEVTSGYWITPYFKDIYYDLLSVLKSGAQSHNKLMPKDFLRNLDSQVPDIASKKRIPNSTEIIKLRSDITEEREKPYFDTWIHWNEKGPSRENMFKTFMILGKEAVEYSKNFNASSRWSSVDCNRTWRENIN